MNIRQFSVMLIALVVIAIGAWLFAARIHAQGPTTDVWALGGPHKVLDLRARAVNGNDETSVRALTENVFTVYPHAFGRMPADLEGVLKDRLTQAEVDHLRGIRPGVKEADVATVVNMMAERLHLPEYAKTSAKQVRTLRMSLTLASPAFMGRGMTEANGKFSDSINPEMSPLQASHLTAVLLDQKFMDPDYQVTPAEWDEKFHEKEIARLERQDTLRRSSDPRKPAKYMIGARVNPKRDEMRQAFSAGVANLSAGDAMDMMNSALTTFGIQH